MTSRGNRPDEPQAGQRLVVLLLALGFLAGAVLWQFAGDRHALSDRQALLGGDVTEESAVLEAFELDREFDPQFWPEWSAFVKSPNGSAGGFDPHGRGTILEEYDGEEVTALVHDGRILAVRLEEDLELTSQAVGWRAVIGTAWLSLLFGGLALWLGAWVLFGATRAVVPGCLLAGLAPIAHAIGTGNPGSWVLAVFLVPLILLPGLHPGWRRSLHGTGALLPRRPRA